MTKPSRSQFHVHALHVQAHRGASTEFRENTLAAFRRAIEVGADSIELDIHLSKDQYVVVFHDFELKKASVGNWLFSDIQKHDREIPSLQEVFSLCQKSKIILDIELKWDATFSTAHASFAETVLGLIEKEWDFARTVLRSFDHALLQEVRRRKPKVQIAALIDSKDKDFERVLEELKPEILAPAKESVTRLMVETAHRKNAKVIPYTANSVKDWEKLIHLGVDGITTDDPAGLVAYLQKGEE